MKAKNNFFSVKEFKKDLWLSLKVTLIFTVVFTLINQEFTLTAIANTLLISAMYSFGLGLGNGLINDYLNTKWSWVTETNARVWAGIISTVIYTLVAVFIIQYIQYVIIFGRDFDEILGYKSVYYSYFFWSNDLSRSSRFFPRQRFYDPMERIGN